MKAILALIILVSFPVLANTPRDCNGNQESLSIDQAKKIGIELSVSKNLSEMGCYLINVLSPKKLKKHKFSSVSVYLTNSNGFVGGFDLHSGLNQFNEHTTPFEICESSVENVKILIGYGKLCGGESYVININPKEM